MAYEDLDEMGLQFLHTYFDKHYTTNSGKYLRFVVGRFKQSVFRGNFKFYGALVIIHDKAKHRGTIHVYREPNTIPLLKLKRSNLTALAKEKAEPEDFIEELESILNSEIEANTAGDDFLSSDFRFLRREDDGGENIKQF
jgi:hypothetical protein